MEAKKKNHSDRKNGASREAWMKAKKVGRPYQTLVTDQLVDGTVVKRYIKTSRA